MAQIISITSEALQATVRRLLPSQQGFGEDLQASNVILPIIDLTPTAEGSQLPGYLQNALDFASSFNQVSNTTTTFISTPGFYRVFGTVTFDGSGTGEASIFLEDGAAFKNVYIESKITGGNAGLNVTPFDFVLFVENGKIARASTNSVIAQISVMARQIADVYGNLTDPQGLDVQ